jgi:hypothetical protein
MSEAELKDMVISIAKRYGWLVHHDLPAQNSRGRWMTNVQGDVGFLICSWCTRSKAVGRW